ncbi:MAG: CBS domain-containing protein [Pseudomonadota bacterium]|nr:CBS domain-containing protein [Pseudomonadota bacterium]
MPITCNVKDFMSTNPVTLSPDTDVMTAVHMLTEMRVPGAPVVDQVGNLVGYLAERDCLVAALNAAYHHESGGPVSEYMHGEIATVDVETSITDVAQLLIESGNRGYPVVKDDRLIGQIHRSDVLKALTLWRESPRGKE